MGPAGEPQLREAPVMNEGSWVGLDVHARSGGAGGIAVGGGAVYDATAWTRGHDAWLRKQRFQGGPLATVFDECYSRMMDAKTRRDTLDKAITELAASEPYVDVVERLVCLRGVSTLTAFALTVELGDWNRFRPQALGPFPGLTPRENTNRRGPRQGGVTKTRNTPPRPRL